MPAMRRRPATAWSAAFARPRPCAASRYTGGKGRTRAPTSTISVPVPIALQRMLVQEAGDKILLLPAWPADWDVDFKLRLAHGGAAHRHGQVRKTARLGPSAGVTQEGCRGLPAAKRRRRRSAHPAKHSSVAGRRGPDGPKPVSGQDRPRDHVPRQLIPPTIRELAAGDRSKPIAGKQVAGSWMNPQAGEKLATRPTTSAASFRSKSGSCPARASRAGSSTSSRPA